MNARTKSCDWRRAVLAGVLLFSAGATGQDVTLDRIRVESRTQQFVVHGPSSETVTPESSGSRYVRVTPYSLAIICSRIRAAFNEQIGLEDRWKHRVHVVINPLLASDSDVLVAASRLLNGWVYRIEMPQRIAKEKLARSVVRTLLQEYADRSTEGRSAAIPLWVTEGTTQQVLRSAATPLFPPVKERSAIAFERGDQAGGRVEVRLVENPDAEPFVFSGSRYEEPLKVVKEALGRFEAMTFADFGVAEEKRLSGDEWTLFQACSHLFVARLLELPKGRTAFQGMLGESSNFLNWQLAFLKGFEAHFTTPLDVEKWWSLQIFNMSPPDLETRLGNLAGLARLDAVLDSSVTVRTGEGEGESTESDQFPLQVMMDLVDYADQRAAIMEIVLRLRRLRWLLSDDLIKLTDDYARELNEYIARRDKARGSRPRRGRVSANEAMIVRQTLDRLKLLDIIRADTRAIEEAAERERAKMRALEQVRR